MSDSALRSCGVREEVERPELRTDPETDINGDGQPSGNSAKQKKLILHIDLNNTILVSDAVTRQGTVTALEYFLSTVTWGHMSKGTLYVFVCLFVSWVLHFHGCLLKNVQQKTVWPQVCD